MRLRDAVQGAVYLPEPSFSQGGLYPLERELRTSTDAGDRFISIADTDFINPLGFTAGDQRRQIPAPLLQHRWQATDLAVRERVAALLLLGRALWARCESDLQTLLQQNATPSRLRSALTPLLSAHRQAVNERCTRDGTRAASLTLGEKLLTALRQVERATRAGRVVKNPLTPECDPRSDPIMRIDPELRSHRLPAPPAPAALQRAAPPAALPSTGAAGEIAERRPSPRPKQEEDRFRNELRASEAAIAGDDPEERSAALRQLHALGSNIPPSFHRVYQKAVQRAQQIVDGLQRLDRLDTLIEAGRIARAQELLVPLLNSDLPPIRFEARGLATRIEGALEEPVLSAPELTWRADLSTESDELRALLRTAHLEWRMARVELSDGRQLLGEILFPEMHLHRCSIVNPYRQTSLAASLDEIVAIELFPSRRSSLNEGRTPQPP